MTKFTSTGLVLIGIGIGACAGHFAPALTAHAAPAHRCDYTYIQDTGGPEIGERGAVAYDDDWQAVLSAGFQLRLTAGVFWVFERCQ